MGRRQDTDLYLQCQQPEGHPKEHFYWFERMFSWHSNRKRQRVRFVREKKAKNQQVKVSQHDLKERYRREELSVHTSHVCMGLNSYMVLLI